MGVVQETAPPTFPQGFPPDVVALVARGAPRGVTRVGPAEAALVAREGGGGVSGGEPSESVTVLERHGPRHLETGELILYTSQDSVLQLAAHVDVMGEDDLYGACRRVRGGTEVARVIARPFEGAPGSFARTDGRRDFALDPPRRSYLDALAEAGIEVDAVGKVTDLFAG